MTEPPIEGRPCCLRLPHGGWCELPDGHAGDHLGMPYRYGPEAPSADVMLRRRMAREATELLHARRR